MTSFQNNRIPVYLQHPELNPRSRHSYICHLAEQRGVYCLRGKTLVLMCSLNIGTNDQI